MLLLLENKENENKKNYIRAMATKPSLIGHSTTPQLICVCVCVNAIGPERERKRERECEAR